MVFHNNDGLSLLWLTKTAPVWLAIYFLVTWDTASTRPSNLSLANLTTTLVVNGQRHAMTIRSAASTTLIASHRVPVLLLLHGGPGASDIPFLYETDYLLEEQFIVVHYDQRSAGKSCRYYDDPKSQQQPQQNLTIRQHVDDAVVIVEYLKREFRQEKIFLAGGSWGSVLVLLLAKQYPQLFHGVAVHGVLVDGLANELISREFILSQFPNAATATTTTTTSETSSGNQKSRQRLLPSLPMPPYESVEELKRQRRWLSHAGGIYYRHPLEPLSRHVPYLNRFSLEFQYAKHILTSPEYSWRDKLSFESCSTETTHQMMEEVFRFNAYKQIIMGRGVGGGGEREQQQQQKHHLQVPILFIHGRHDHMCVMELVEDFVKALHSPWKKLIWFEQSGHFPDREEPVLFQQTLTETFSHHYYHHHYHHEAISKNNSNDDNETNQEEDTIKTCSSGEEVANDDSCDANIG